MTRMAGRRTAFRGSQGLSWPAAAGPAAVSAEVQADDFVSDLYQAHALALVQVAKLLLRDQPSAEDVVQDAFLSLYQALPRLKDHDQILPYLRAAVINRSRSVLRARRRAVLRRVQHEPPGLPYPQCWASLNPSGQYLLVQYSVSVPNASDWVRPAILDLRSGRLTQIAAPAYYRPLDVAW
jgi:RNA polymerase sigma factor (sigma-70 family)